MQIFLKLNKTLLVVALVFFSSEKIFLTTMLTILKSYLQLIRLKKRKKLFIQNTIYNSGRFKKHLI